jgi:RNA polymerase sigma factor (sigma-70 family)
MDEFFDKYLHGLPQPLSKIEQDEVLKKYFRLKEENGLGRDTYFNCEERDLLITHNLRLVYKICYRYRNYADIHDLFSEGYTGFIKYLDKFDFSKGFAFSTYISCCVDGVIKRSLDKKKNGLKNDALKVLYEVSCEDGGEFDDQFLGAKEDDFIKNYGLRDCFQKCLQSVLTPVERDVFEYYYGLKDGREYSQPEIARILNSTQSNISKILVRARNKMKEYYFNCTDLVK